MRLRTLLNRGVRAVGNALRPGNEDILILELGTRQPGDMARLLRIVEPTLIIIMPLAPEYSEDIDALATQRTEIRGLLEHAAARGIDVVACQDDATIAALAHGPRVHLFGRHHLVSAAGHCVVRIEGEEVVVDSDLVGESAIYAAIATVLIERLLNVR